MKIMTAIQEKAPDGSSTGVFSFTRILPAAFIGMLMLGWISIMVRIHFTDPALAASVWTAFDGPMNWGAVFAGGTVIPFVMTEVRKMTKAGSQPEAGT